MKSQTRIGLGLGVGLLLIAVALVPDTQESRHDRKPVAARPVAAQPAAVKPAAAKGAEPEFRKMAGLENWAMIAEPGMAPEAYETASRERCVGKSLCSVYAWTDASQAATALPMDDRQVSAQVYSYTLNRTTNFERSLWNCAVFPTMAGKQGVDRCLATGD